MKKIRKLFDCLTVSLLGLTGSAFCVLAVVLARYALELEALSVDLREVEAAPYPPPTLEMERAGIPTESFLLLPDENLPVAFSAFDNGERLAPADPAPQEVMTLGPAPRVLPAISRFLIPSLGMDWEVAPVGLITDESGLWYYATPEEAVGWHEGSGLPGSGRSIEFNGHVRWNGNNGVFRYLSSAALEDEIILRTEDGAEHRYLTRQILIKSPADTARYTAELSERGEELVVAVTCINWSTEEQKYLDRLIVVAVHND